MVDDDWASQRQIMPVFTGEVTVIGGLIKMQKRVVMVLQGLFVLIEIQYN